MNLSNFYDRKKFCWNILWKTFNDYSTLNFSTTTIDNALKYISKKKTEKPKKKCLKRWKYHHEISPLVSISIAPYAIIGSLISR